MGATRRIAVAPIPTERFRGVLRDEEYKRLEALVLRAREALAGRVVFNVSSTSTGGGVVELLRSLIGYARGAGVDARWKVITAGPEFFEVTKRIHNRLHGFEGDGGPLGAARAQDLHGRAGAQRARAAVAHRARRRRPPARPADGRPHARAGGARRDVIWRAHVGLDLPNERAREAWEFLRPYVASAESFVFSRDGVRLGRAAARADAHHLPVDRCVRAQEPGARARDRRPRSSRRSASSPTATGARPPSPTSTGPRAASTTAPRSSRTRR